MYGKHSKSVGQFLCGLLSVAAAAKGLRQVRHGRVGDARVGGGDGGGEVQLEVDQAAVAGQVQVVAAKLLALLWITRAVRSYNVPTGAVPCRARARVSADPAAVGVCFGNSIQLERERLQAPQSS